MSTFAETQDQRYLDLVARTVLGLRDAADRIEREATRPPGAYATRITQAGDIVHGLHSALANLPLYNLIQCAHEAAPRAEERQS